jgi:hypothetical protein
MQQSHAVLSFSDNLYRRFLRAYPAEYRQGFSEDMAQVFRDLCREIYERQGLAGFLELWLTTLFDLFKTVIEERSKEVVQMTKEKFVRLSGWALMLAGATFMLGFAIGGGETSFSDPLGGSDAFYEYSQLVLVPLAMASFAVGMLGMRSRYGAQVGRFGSISLVIGSIGGGIGLIGAIGLGLIIEGDEWWLTWSFGMLLVLVGLLLFGIAAVRKKPLPRWNALPLITGSLILLMPIMGVISGSDELSTPVLATIFLLIAAGFVALGFVVQGDSVEEMSAA